MSRQQSKRLERSTAVRAFEGFIILAVFPEHVHFQVRALSKGPATLLTGERFLSRMNSQMLGHVTFSLGGIAAELTVMGFAV